MANITATITVDFQANYTGNHRVCWRVQGSGDPYDCNTSVSCVGGGAVCQAVFTVPLNSTSCDGDVIIEGYVQAECEDVLSTNGRVPFVTNPFTPTPTCIRHEITCDHVGILSVSISSSGSNYAVGDVINIIRNSSDTETMDASITVSSVDGSGGITGVNISNPGSYQIQPTYSITSASGSGAVLSIIMDTCPSVSNLGTDCSTNTISLTNGLILGETFATCVVGSINLPEGYTDNTIGCCIPSDTVNDVCYNYDLNNTTGSDVTIHYTACNGIDSSILVQAGTTVIICAVTGGVINPNITGFTITQTTNCA
jgi:hypothetical protein